MNQLYPIFLKLSGRRCLVVGGGDIAVQKALGLLQCGGQVTVISHALSGSMYALMNGGKIAFHQSSFKPCDTAGFFLVIAATDSPVTNTAIADECARHGILCNVADDTERGDFHTPAVVRRGDLKIAISTNGKCPMLSKKIRQELEEMFTQKFALFIRYLGFLRSTLRQLYSENRTRRQQILAHIINSDIFDLLQQDKRKQFREKIYFYLDSSQEN